MKITLFNTKLARYYIAAGDTGFKTTTIRNYATTFHSLEIAAAFRRNVIGPVDAGVVVSLEAYKQPALTALEKFVHEAYAQHRSTTDIASSLNRSVASVEQAWGRADDKLKEIAAIAAKDAAAIAAQQPAAEPVVIPAVDVEAMGTTGLIDYVRGDHWPVVVESTCFAARMERAEAVIRARHNHNRCGEVVALFKRAVVGK